MNVDVRRLSVYVLRVQWLRPTQSAPHSIRARRPLSAAIHAVINADRTLTEHELLITTACELLVEGALETAELARQVDEV